MSNNSGLAGNLWEAFINYVFKSGDLNVPAEYHERCVKINEMMDNDVTGIVSTITTYSVNSASEANLKVECNDETLENILNIWLSRININVDGIPTGLRELAKEYYKERWQGSSLCLMRISNWEKITVGQTTIKVPTVLWFVNGASIYIKRPNKTNYKLGTDKFFLDKNEKNELPKSGEQILVTKPFSRWFDEYPSPYAVKTGVLKNFLGLQALFSKGDEVISKVLPYLLIMTKGTEREMIEGDMSFDDPELQKMAENFKTVLERYKNEKAKTPVAGFPFDQKLEHFIPDLRNILSEELSKAGYRALMAGLGFIAVLQGIGDTRKEELINPKPFITEVNAGLSDFKSMLMDVIRLIISENKLDHRKLFSENKNLQITNSPLKINVESILDSIRSAFVYGTITIETFQETLGINPSQELERMKKEWKEGMRELYYPHIIQNTEKDPDTNISPAPITKKQEEKQKEKEKKPENMQEASLVTCKKCNKEIDYLKQPEAGMGYIKCPECGENIDQEGNFAKVINEPIDPNLEIAPYKNIDALPDAVKKYPAPAQKVFLEVFNSIYNETKDEARAFQGAWSKLKKYMERHYIKKDNKWIKKGEDK